MFTPAVSCVMPTKFYAVTAQLEDLVLILFTSTGPYDGIILQYRHEATETVIARKKN
jgi:hypothetical protein